MRLKRFVSLDRVVELRRVIDIKNPNTLTEPTYEVWVLRSNGQIVNDVIYVTSLKSDAEKMYKIECENKEAK